MLPNDDVLNTRIDTLPVDPHSNTWFSQLPAMSMSYAADWGLSTFSNTTPAQNLQFVYTPGTDGPYQVPSWPNLREEDGNFDTYSNTDHHIVAVNENTCEFFDIYNIHSSDSSGNNAQSGAKYSGTSFDLPISGASDAAGMELSPLTLHLSELESGHIDHALRFTLPNTDIVANHVWPATGNAYPYSQTLLPYGTRLRLKSTSVNMSNFSPMAQTLLTQLEQYGMLLADGSSYFSVTTDQDVYEDPSAVAAMNEVAAAINLSDFEAVDETTLMIDASSGAVNPAYAAGGSYAVVVATDNSNSSNTSSSRLSLNGVGVGVSDAAVNILAGSTVQLSAWTTGTNHNPSVAWETNPSVGTMTPSGLYTAPTVAAPIFTYFTVYSVENPAAKQVLAAHIIPAGPDGVMRFSVGWANNGTDDDANYGPDSNTNMWWADPGFYSTAYLYCDNHPIAGIFSRYCHDDGNDWTHDFLVPNGNYRITLYMALDGTPATNAQSSWNIGAQGQWTNSGFNILQAANNNTKQPLTLSFPAQVTNNLLSFTMSNLIIPNGLVPTLSGFTIAPDDNTVPHLVIQDASGNTNSTSVASNSSEQLSAVGWYMPSDVNWFISPGIGNISPSGLYTAPTTPVAATVTVTAISKADPSKTATILINVREGQLNILPASQSVVRSMTDQMSGNLNGASYSDVTWSASSGSIDCNGLFTAPDGITQNTPVVITATSTDDPTLAATYTVTVLANIPAIRINTGDWYEAVTDANGNVWSTDPGSTPGCMSYFAAPFTMTAGIELDGRPLTTSSPMAPIYNSARYSSYCNNQFSYQFNVPNGTYRVTLLFGNYGQAPHFFNFNVLANGNTVISNYDPDSPANRGGIFAGSNRAFAATVTNKTLTLTFIGNGSKEAEVDGIQIVPATLLPKRP